MKKLGITIVVIIVVIIIALLVAPSFINVDQFRGRIVAEIQQRTGRSVQLGKLHLRLLPPKFSADNAVIGDDPNFNSERPFAQVQQLNVSVALLPLLHKDVQISSLELDHPQVELIRNAKGVWNFSTIGQQPAAQNAQTAAPQRESKTQPKQTPAQPQQPEQTKSSSAPSNFQLNDLTINDGQVAVTDMQKNQPRAVYNHIDLHLANYAQGKPFDLTLAAHLPGNNNPEIKLSGTAGPIDNANTANTPLKADVTLQNVAISGVEKFLNSPALAGDDAIISGKTSIENAPNKFASSGDLKFDQVKLHGHDVGYPINANYAVSSAGKELRIDKGDLRLGSTPIAISGTVNTEPTPMNVALKLKASDVSIQEIARLAAAAGVAFNPNLNIAGKVSANITADGPATKPAMNGTINASGLDISGKDLPQPVRVNSVQLALTPTDIRSNKFAASTGSTSLNVQFALSGYTSNAPNVDATVNTQNANIGEFLNIAKAYGVSAAEGMTGSGLLSLNVHATGPIKNSEAMKFSGDGQVTNAQIKPPQFTQPLKVRNANLRFSQNSAILDNLSASLGSTNASGNANVSNFANPNVQFTLAADKVNVTELQQITGAQDSTPQQQRKTAENFWSLIPRANAAPAQQPSMLDKMTGGGNLTVGTILYNNLQLTNVHSKVTLDRGLIHLDPTTAQLFGGQETGAIVLDARPTPMTYTVNAKLSKVDANQLISSISPAKGVLYGLLNADANTSFGSGGGDIARSLNGTAAINLLNGKLAKIDILNQLASIGKFSGAAGTAAKGFTNLVKLAGTFNIKNGVAETNNLQAAIDGGTLAGTGAIDLANQSLNMKITAVLNNAMAKTIGGTSIGGFMQTALANKNGELVMPILVSGPLSSPHFAPDVQAIAQMKLHNLLPTSANPGAATSGILGSILGGKQGQAGQNPVGGILGQITGQQKQQGANGMPQSDQNQPQKQQQQQQQQKKPLQNLLNGILNKKQQNQQPPPQQPQ